MSRIGGVELKEYSLLRDLVSVRELPAPKDSEVILQIDNPNKRRETVINGIVEKIGPKVKGVSIGDKVWYEIEMGKARLPWDVDVRIMAEDQIAFIET
jgi:hypothetical protein